MNTSSKKTKKLALKLDTVKTLTAPDLVDIVGGMQSTRPISFATSCTGSCRFGCQ